MTDGTSQGLFIVVAIVIFGIFVVLAYILFEDTLSPALANMFTEATEQASTNLLGKEINLYEHLVRHGSGSSFAVNGDEILVTSDGSDFDGLRIIQTAFKPNKQYKLSFKVQKNSGDMVNLGGNLAVSDKATVKLDGRSIPVSETFNNPMSIYDESYSENVWWNGFVYPNDNEWHDLEITFDTTRWFDELVETSRGTYRSFYIQFNRWNYKKPHSYTIKDLKFIELK